MDASTKARLIVVDYILNELEMDRDEAMVNLKVNVFSVSQHGDDWTAVVSTNAHTDCYYRVTYRSETGQTSVATFTQSDERHIWSNAMQAASENTVELRPMSNPDHA